MRGARRAPGNIRQLSRPSPRGLGLAGRRTTLRASARPRSPSRGQKTTPTPSQGRRRPTASPLPPLSENFPMNRTLSARSCVHQRQRFAPPLYPGRPHLAGPPTIGRRLAKRVPRPVGGREVGSVATAVTVRAARAVQATAGRTPARSIFRIRRRALHNLPTPRPMKGVTRGNVCVSLPIVFKNGGNGGNVGTRIRNCFMFNNLRCVSCSHLHPRVPTCGVGTSAFSPFPGVFRDCRSDDFRPINHPAPR